MMNNGGAYGGGKAGGTFDPIAFAQRPQVILRALCWFFSIIVFGCVSSGAWREENGKEVCLFDNDATACKYGSIVGIFGFLASMGFIGGEYFFEQMSSVKSRKHYVLGDLGFSGFWAFLYFIAFIYLWSQWSSAATPPNGEGVGSVQAIIVFSFFSIFTWAGCAFLAYKRFLIGAEAAFASTFESDPVNQEYTNYPMENETDQYSQSPFTGQQQTQQVQGEYQQPTY